MDSEELNTAYHAHMIPPPPRELKPAFSCITRRFVRFRRWIIEQI